MVEAVKSDPLEQEVHSNDSVNDNRQTTARSNDDASHHSVDISTLQSAQEPDENILMANNAGEAGENDHESLGALNLREEQLDDHGDMLNLGDEQMPLI